MSKLNIFKEEEKSRIINMNNAWPYVNTSMIAVKSGRETLYRNCHVTHEILLKITQSCQQFLNFVVSGCRPQNSRAQQATRIFVYSINRQMLLLTRRLYCYELQCIKIVARYRRQTRDIVVRRELLSSYARYHRRHQNIAVGREISPSDARSAHELSLLDAKYRRQQPDL